VSQDAAEPLPSEGGGQHYFSTRPTGPDTPRELPVTLAGRDVRVLTSGGIFSPDRIDLGTRVLLREAPAPPPTGQLLDLGCGWGPLALTMAMLSPKATVWALDVNERALDLMQTNAGRLGLTGIRPVRPDEVPADLQFDAIWSNPPIRVGKPALHALLLQWLPRLARGAAAHLVVQRNLGADSLQAWLIEALSVDHAAAHGGRQWTVRRHGSAKGYRVLTVSETD
jgi:16S rRNA (guanine1207-N2)-methyltransferase